MPKTEPKPEPTSNATQEADFTDAKNETPVDVSTSDADDGGTSPVPDSERTDGATASLWRLVTSDTLRLGFRRYTPTVVIVVIVGVIAVIARVMQLDGHDWGDDFALYMRQARALTIGNIGEVIADNRFSVDNSGWHTFSPYSYPWGWPLLVAPLYALFGLDYEVFKLLEIGAFCVFLLVFFAIIRPRVGALAATLLTLLIGLSVEYVGATNTVLSDIPYLGFVGLSLWWMERCRVRGILAVGRRDLLILGILLAYTYNVRREGIVLLLSLVGLHAASLAAPVVRTRSLQFLRQVDWRHVLLPYTAFIASIIVFHLLLPTVLLPSAPGAGLQNISSRLEWYRDVLAQQIGLKQIGEPIQLLQSQVLGQRVLTLLVLLAIIGVFTRLLFSFTEDIALASYLCGASLLMLISPYQENRYLLTVTPLLAYFAYQALAATAQTLISKNRALAHIVTLVPAVLLSGLVLLNAQTLGRSFAYHRDYQYTMHGPETPNAKEMFLAVQDRTRAEDVILFFRSRAMTLYTDRRSIMGTNLDDVLHRSDWYVMAKESTYSQNLLTDTEASALGLTKTWENSGWVMWQVPSPLPRQDESANATPTA